MKHVILLVVTISLSFLAVAAQGNTHLVATPQDEITFAAADTVPFEMMVQRPHVLLDSTLLKRHSLEEISDSFKRLFGGDIEVQWMPLSDNSSTPVVLWSDVTKFYYPLDRDPRYQDILMLEEIYGQRIVRRDKRE